MIRPSYIASTSERYSSAVGLVKPTTDRLRGVIAYLQRVRMLNSPKRHWTFWKSILSKSNAYIDMVHKVLTVHREFHKVLCIGCGAGIMQVMASSE